MLVRCVAVEVHAFWPRRLMRNHGLLNVIDIDLKKIYFSAIRQIEFKKIEDCYFTSHEYVYKVNFRDIINE